MLGAGSWGTALAAQLARNGADVALWGRDEALIERIAAAGENPVYLPGVALPDGLRATGQMAEAMAGAALVLLVCPSHAFTEVLSRARRDLPGSAHLAWASKGFEPGTGRLLHECADELVGADHPKAVITGPSFAREVAQGLPTALTAASRQPACLDRVSGLLHGGAFRVYTSDDIVGAELGGAAKNVYAIATGIADGMGLGNNARAALITRGLHEMMRLAAVLGARQETLMGLSGMGDLVLTCTGESSRNHRFGYALGQGADRESSLAEIAQVVEGVRATRELCRLTDYHHVDAPIAHLLREVLTNGVTPEEGMHALLSRDQKHEHQ